MGSALWWGKVVLVALFSLFFLLFGIENLVGAFHLKNPLEFIVYFFSASLMVLVSVAGILYAVFRIRALFFSEKNHIDET